VLTYPIGAGDPRLVSVSPIGTGYHDGRTRGRKTSSTISVMTLSVGGAAVQEELVAEQVGGQGRDPRADVAAGLAQVGGAFQDGWP
jgi:hypothetical protein